MHSVFLYLMLLPLISYTQVIDAFTDSNFTENPTWIGDTACWTIENEQLKSKSDSSSFSFCLSTSSNMALNCQWELFINLKFQTSSANYTDIYLIADSADLKSTTRSGYFVRIGNTSDEISLYKNLKGTLSKIIDGEDARVNSSNNSIHLYVSRDADNVWCLKSNTKGEGFPFIVEGSVIDSSITSSTYFGILVQQSTASFHHKHYFDDLYIGPIKVDSIPPTMISNTIISNHELDLLFDETIALESSETIENYFVNNSIGNPIFARRDKSNFSLLHLSFLNPFIPSTNYTLQVMNIQDLNSNIIPDTNLKFSYSAPDTALSKDIIINEIFADPTPQQGLPPAEFIEIYNRSEKFIDLNNWKFSDGSSISTLSNYTLSPTAYLILCSKADTALFQSYGRVMGLSSFPVLNNAGDHLTLKNEQQLLIDSVHYSVNWFTDESKKTGGWSLELSNPNASIDCPASSYWTASSNPIGGTPGNRNSNFTLHDTTSTHIVEASIITPTLLEVHFSSTMNINSLHDVTAYNIDHGIGIPLQAHSANDDFTSIQLTLGNALKAGIDYSLTLTNLIFNCAGVQLPTSAATHFNIPETAMPNDIVINEVLFNPFANGIDFIEIYNRSNKIINLNALSISRYDTSNQALIKNEPITSNNYWMQPKEYVLLSENGEIVQGQYHSNYPLGFIDMKNLPAMSDKSGTIALSRSSTIIDLFGYQEEMHFPLLNNTEGVSLERIDFNRPAADKTNWHSASESIGFASPGYENSQYYKSHSIENPMEVLPKIFSPDEDGVNDIVNINFHFDTPGLTASITIYDSQGRLARLLLQNKLLGTEETFSWDGINENREKGKMGIYIVYAEVLNLSGQIKHYKKTCVLAHKIND